MPPNEIDVNPLTVAVALASTVLGPTAAAYVGTYAVILIGWFAGLLYGLFTRAPDARMPVWAYTMFTLCVTLATTVPISQLLTDYLHLQTSLLLFPVALAIPAAPDKWGAAGNWLIQKWLAMRGVRQ